MNMSASRPSRFMRPAVGLAVRISNEDDVCAGLIGFITELGDGIARIDFCRGDRIPRWFTFDEFVDERIAQTEQLVRIASGYAAAGDACVLTFESLEALEAVTCRLSPALRA